MKKVMLVDDDGGILGLLAVTLNADDRYTLVMAMNGEQALTLARKERPNLVFLDVNLPDMDGYAVCYALKHDPNTLNIKVIMLTAMARETDRERGRAVGADGYFTKPFSPSALLEKVSEMLGLT